MSTLTTADSLLTAICADEDSDHPRLVYADMLMQSNDEATRARGEFIAIQCILAQPDCTDERTKLEAHESKLLRDHKAAWLAPLKLTDNEIVSVKFHRGFIETLKMSISRFVDVSPALVKHPRLSLDSGFTKRTPELFLYFLSESMLKLKGLNIVWLGKSVEGAKAIAFSRYFRNLTDLDLSVTYIGSEGMKILSESEHLRNLTSLNLSGTGSGVEGASALANSEYLKNITRLDLSTNSLGDKGALALLRSKNLQNLTKLNLRWNNISDDVAITLKKRWPFAKV